MVDDTRLFASVRYATLFLGGVALFAAGMWQLTPAISELVQCSVKGAICAGYVAREEWVLGGSGVVFWLVAAYLFLAARSVHRSVLLGALREQ